ncbi:MAG: hypothetical protein JXA53_01050 [Bacteroidales bacterium]|nr:hypothetical protein [Bacteroidales bacterium]
MKKLIFIIVSLVIASTVFTGCEKDEVDNSVKQDKCQNYMLKNNKLLLGAAIGFIDKQQCRSSVSDFDFEKGVIIDLKDGAVMIFVPKEYSTDSEFTFLYYSYQDGKIVYSEDGNIENITKPVSVSKSSSSCRQSCYNHRLEVIDDFRKNNWGGDIALEGITSLPFGGLILKAYIGRMCSYDCRKYI